MNKLMGFYELRDSGLPAVPWKIFDNQVRLEDNRLWTIRTAIKKGNDLNLPRAVGLRGSEAYKFALELYNQYKDYGMIIYYPYFLADKSGVMDINSKNLIIEAVDKDLWNLVSEGKRDVTVTLENEIITYCGNEYFLTDKELKELTKYAAQVKALYKDTINEGKSILVEWSFAYDTNIDRSIIGDKYLVFYELRSV